MSNYETMATREILVENVKKLVIHLALTVAVMTIMPGMGGVTLADAIFNYEYWILAMMVYPMIRFALLFRGNLILMIVAFLVALVAIGTLSQKGLIVPTVIGLVGFTACCFGYYIYKIVVCAKALRA